MNWDTETTRTGSERRVKTWPSRSMSQRGGMLLGHASVATTERYTAVDDDEIRAAMMSAGAG
jgi:hypothetical protein